MRGYCLLAFTLAVALILIVSSVDAKSGAGCKNGYCWAYCSPVADLWDWCYTTGGTNMDGSGYARCDGNGGGEGGDYIGPNSEYVECAAYWSCNGPCSL